MPRIDIEQDILTKSDEYSQVIKNIQLPKAIATEESSINEEQENPSITIENTTKNKSIENPAILEQVSPEQVIRFCRHCGGKLDYQSDKFCKHCGKQLY